jgi:hypothetical protein
MTTLEAVRHLFFERDGLTPYLLRGAQRVASEKSILQSMKNPASRRDLLLI